MSSVKCCGDCSQCANHEVQGFNWDMCVKTQTIKLLKRIVVAVEANPEQRPILEQIQELVEIQEEGSAASPKKASS